MLKRTLHAEDLVAPIHRGQVVAYPTEGVFGLGCDAHDRAACERIIELKQRRPEQGMIVLIAEWSQLSDWMLPLNAEQQQRLARHAHDFITWLVPVNEHAPKVLCGEHRTLAVRRPLWSPLWSFCRQLGRPLVSTSANPHGQHAALNAAQVVRYFDGAGLGSKPTIARVWDYPCGGYGRPSSIYSLVDGRCLR